MLKKPYLLLLLSIGVSTLPVAGATKKHRKPTLAEEGFTGPAVLWRQPTDINSRNLYYGPGGKADQPDTVFTFEKEDSKGSNPKFDVRDENGVKWKVKLGEEARPETVASRLVWAAGYFTNEDYFLPSLKVEGLPNRLHRGQKLLAPDGTFHNVRLKRYLSDEKKIGEWSWRNDPFTGTKEWDGLCVMMALINNWDLKDENNAVYEKRSEETGEIEHVYLVSDLGASFGTTGLNRTHNISKGNLQSYSRSRFIRKVTPYYVDFNVPSRPSLVVLLNPHEFFSRLRLEWIGRHIPRDEARRMGQLLVRLSPDQVRDAFRAAGYSPAEVEAFTGVVERRIGELNAL
jgi:hypothetical protein